MTCNPNWPEIKDDLHPNTTPLDQYDIANRIFHLKAQKLIYLINKANIFVPRLCHMFTVEWQNRGLQHMHLLLWLTSKFRPDKIYNVITAEIPNKDEDPVLHDTMARHMIHRPCDALNPHSLGINNGK